ncbi:YopX family protein [Lacticaseibacillus paracasei]|uniref:YopX family protein n=1 Tax=Lacticaseibacillus paracasei TaxID=1597 RepID=UPI0022EC7D3A|nr:YopX family protein [Lacticaseibacillus paracasei]WBT00351.1 YopX family protein [Lacticaseibacillus paracasei]
MREIKFRGLPTCKDKDELDYINFDRDGNFAVGFYEDGYIVGKVADASDDYISPEFWVAVDKNTVGQYVGRKDKNKREIYEGDIVRTGKDDIGDPEPMIGQVIMRDGSWLIENEKKQEAIDLFSEITSREVIGNIFENPELLEGK